MRNCGKRIWPLHCTLWLYVRLCVRKHSYAWGQACRCLWACQLVNNVHTLAFIQGFRAAKWRTLNDVHFCGFSYYHKLPKIRLLFAHYFEANEGGRLLEYSIYSWILRSAQSMRSTSDVGTIRTRLEEQQVRWTYTTGNQRRLWWIKPRGIDRLVATGDSPAYYQAHVSSSNNKILNHWSSARANLRRLHGVIHLPSKH